jgi:formylglycine-generating enzyme required for sulfatase activity
VYLMNKNMIGFFIASAALLLVALACDVPGSSSNTDVAVAVALTQTAAALNSTAAPAPVDQASTAEPAAASPATAEPPTVDPALEAALAGVSSNAAWSPVVRDFNGISMVLVPKGCFQMGSDIASASALPVTQQCFDQPFWIDQLEVTNKQYGSSGAQTGDSLPRDSLTWHDASDFCASRGARLPTEAEWEYAARGPDALDYPWGNTFDTHALNFCDKNCYLTAKAMMAASDNYGGTAPVGSYPQGASWVGALDMSGNVWEWVSSKFMPYPYNSGDGREGAGSEIRVLRGGSYMDDVVWTRSAFRNGINPDVSTDASGVRCAQDN